MAIFIVILSIVLTFIICSVINKNTIGTTYAYIRRAFLVWLVVIAVLAGVCSKIGIF